ncbi:MAG: sulfate reduction electron transfer complex DsrMKJOP subunit DsrJ [Planctomycetota bacterium]
MKDKPVIIAGLVVFLAAATFPVWYNPATGGTGPRPRPEPPAGETKCVEDKAYMTANHMKLLHEWRETVVREGGRFYTSHASGEQHEMSLVRTCLRCHANKETFCDRCHNYVDVHPRCWDCHVAPEGK